MDGEIYVESSPNIGSQFTCHINFDIASEEMISKLRSKTTLPMQQLPSYEGETVLLVEDNITNQVVVQKLLKGTGLKVYIANNGQEAVFMSLARVYDIVLMDIQMPVMDGYTATKIIRTMEGLSELPIIAMTANAMAGDREKAIASGMTDHIPKHHDIKSQKQAASSNIR